MHSHLLADMPNIELSTSGTDNHIVLVKLGNKDITGSKMEKVCEKCGISLNKNTVPGDKNPMNPTGIRIGTSAMTTRGCTENDMIEIGQFLLECIEIVMLCQNKYGRELKKFNEGLENDSAILDMVKNVRNKIEAFTNNLVWY